MTAAQYGHLRLARLLVEQGANVNAANSVAATAPKSPNTREQRRLPGFVATMSDLYATNPAGWTALTFAANWGHADMVKFLLSQGAYANIRDKSKRTPLYYAQSVHHPEVVRILKDALAKGK